MIQPTISSSATIPKTRPSSPQQPTSNADEIRKPPTLIVSRHIKVESIPQNHASPSHAPRQVASNNTVPGPLSTPLPILLDGKAEEEVNLRNTLRRSVVDFGAIEGDTDLEEYYVSVGEGKSDNDAENSSC